MDRIEREEWLRLIRNILLHLKLYPLYYPLPSKWVGEVGVDGGFWNALEDELFLARLDVQRALQAGCEDAAQIFDFLRVADEGWFFQEDVQRRANLRRILAEVQKHS